ncbi:MAG: hypothetical protein IMZ46_19485 [Acidobacteria bacterium]|nr:hypothetical protein [Acidobacteriota bacterium]
MVKSSADSDCASVDIVLSWLVADLPSLSSSGLPRVVVAGTNCDEECEVGSAALPILIESERVKSMEFGRSAGCRGGDIGVLAPSLCPKESLPMSKLFPRSCCCSECLGGDGATFSLVSNVCPRSSW